jgi:hypothetical protein
MLSEEGADQMNSSPASENQLQKSAEASVDQFNTNRSGSGLVRSAAVLPKN